LARKILLADDSVTAQNMGRKILADAGYEIIAVNNGSAALKKIAELKPDLVILDVYMPGYSGLEVCQRLKESPETARIPVLLTVGKLEPFKPEEAQRVRAEGFIVKPFEASELLGTLSKMEDKVVPRAEPSKPGRFARAIAATEESSRGGREAANTDIGWKNRIGFPKDKDKDKAEEEKIADESTASAEKTWEKKQQAGQPPAGAAETNVDLAALAPAGLPKDVTPEEVAAIAAAAAQMQRVVSALKGESQASATQLVKSKIPKAEIAEAKTAETIVESTSPANSEQASHRAEVNLPASPEVAASKVEVEAKTEALPESKSSESKNEEAKRDSVSEEAPAPETYRRRKDDARAEETQDLPVTMAATAESVVAASRGGSRWTAVSVALEGSEAAISLDHEMQKAHAAFAAADSASSARVPETEPVSAANSSAPARATIESPAPISSAEPAKVPEPATPAPVTVEITPAEASAETSPTGAFAESNQKPAPVAEAVPSVAQESQPRAESEPVATASSSTVPPSTAREEEAPERPTTESAPEPKLDSETVKNTAAAWATWRQVHDSSQSNQVAEARPKEKETDQPESALPEVARAVAAGAEQISQEALAGAADSDQSNVASIVDSVLADLRPKLMEEINRKMSKKK
jgi:CheY-like chemotaxis protein